MQQNENKDNWTWESVGARIDSSQSLRCAEVGYLEYSTVSIDENIVAFDITMHYLVVVLTKYL